MGIFSSKKKTYVSSVAYPLGEDDGEHTPYLQYTMLNAVMQNNNIAESITQGYLRGQGISLRGAYRYARDYYTDGVPQSSVAYAVVPDIEEIRSILEALHPGTDIEFLTTKISSADFLWWGDQYLSDNYGYDPYEENFASPPAGVDVDAEVVYDVESNGDINVLYINADTSTETETFTPAGLVRMKDYVHVAYQTVTTVVDGPTTTTRPAEPGEGDHTETNTVDLDFYTEETTEVVTTVAAGTATDVTTITTVTTSRPKFWMYQIGLGTYPVLDGWLASTDLESPYYPSIPLRVDNEDYGDESHQSTDLYKTGKRVLKKVGIKIEDLVDQINDNEDIEDIDYCYVVFGVNLNAKSQECRRYLYRFFEHLQSVSEVTEDDNDAWVPSSGTSPPTNVLKIFSEENRDKHHDIEIQWQYINTTVETGTVFDDAKPDDVMIAIEGSQIELDLGGGLALDKSKLIATRQIDEDTYARMEIVGLTYENFVYNGKSVQITAWESMQEPDEEDEEQEEGFILPLNYEIIRNTPMVELTDLAYQCNHLVFNCYKVVKQKWYQTGIFKVIIIIIAIVVIVATWGQGTPAVAVSLATMFAEAGISILLAQVLAATIFVLGAMIVTNLITKVSIQLFGEKWGAVIGVIASFVVMNWSNLSTMFGQVATNGLSSIITAQSIMQATTLLSNAYGAYVSGEMSELQQKAMGLWSDYQEDMKKIEDLTKANLGTNLDMIDIQGYMDASFTQLFENPDSFLARTLLTGSDVCEITAGLVSNFAEVGLMLPTS